MKKLSALFLVIFFVVSILIISQTANSFVSKPMDNKVGHIHNAFVVKFSSGALDINPKAEKMIVLTGIWQLDALNQYFRVDRMAPVLPYKTTKPEASGKSRYYLLKCHPLVSLQEVMDTYQALPFVDGVEELGNNRDFFFYPENQKPDANDNSNDSVKKLASDIPLEFSITQNFPNPFNAQTSFSISLPEEMHVNVVVYNVMGQKVKALMDDNLTSGIHTVTWDGTNESEQNVASGVYFYRIVTQENVMTRKMILMK